MPRQRFDSELGWYRPEDYSSAYPAPQHVYTPQIERVWDRALGRFVRPIRAFDLVCNFLTTVGAIVVCQKASEWIVDGVKALGGMM